MCSWRDVTSRTRLALGLMTPRHLQVRRALLIGSIAAVASTGCVAQTADEGSSAEALSQGPIHSYTVTDLGTLGGATSQATGVRDNSIVGLSRAPDGIIHATLWRDGASVDLGTLAPGQRSIAADVVDDSYVVGFALNADGFSRAFFWAEGVMRDLGTLGGVIGRANRMNHQLGVVGFSSLANGQIHAALWEEPTGWPLDLGTLGGAFSAATGINDRGEISGFGTDTAGVEYPVVWDANHEPHSLGALASAGYPNGRAIRINERGDVVGWVATQPGIVEVVFGNTHAFYYAQGTMTDLGTLGGTNSRGYGINNHGQVVGQAETATGALHSFLWQDGAMVDLNSRIPANSGWVLNTTFGIADDGRIVGQGVHNGAAHAYVLTPVED